MAAEKAPELGILYKRAEVFEQAGEVGTVLFDKTGTLTTGVMELSDVVTDENEAEFLQLIASVEAASAHPIGKAVALGADVREIEFVQPENLESHSGLGVTGRAEGHSVVVGKPDLILERGLLVDQRWLDELVRLEKEGKTAFLAGWDGIVRGVIAVADTIRPETPQAVSRLVSLGVSTGMVTGDNQVTASQIGSQLELEHVTAEIPPGGKAEIVMGFSGRGNIRSHLSVTASMMHPLLTQGRSGHCSRIRHRCRTGSRETSFS